MNQFYIELLSNAKCYDDNTVAHFRNKISLDHRLEGKWEVALMEISYTYSWKNVPDEQHISLIQEGNTEDSGIVSKNSQYIRSGYYENIEELIDELQKELVIYLLDDHWHSLPKFKYDTITKYLFLEPGLNREKTSLVLPNISTYISEILGFDNYNPTELFQKYAKEFEIKSDRPPDLNSHLHTLFVYTDIVEPQYIGDTRAKLLKTVEVPSNIKFGTQIVISYNNPHYVPLSFNEFEAIEIDIKDDTNSQIEFLFGRTRLKLHFRKYE